MDLTSMKTTAVEELEHQPQKENLTAEFMDKQSDFMPNLTLGYGVFLVVWGLVVGFLSTSDSLTRFIPCAPGLSSGGQRWCSCEKQS